MNILSIDWDFFINCSKEDRMILFPDCGNENLSMNLQNKIWLNRYVHSNTNEYKPIEDISVKQCYDQIFDLLFNMKDNGKYMFANSHKHCHQFISNLVTEKGEKAVLYNIDYHHDCYFNSGKTLNCGNWIIKLIEENKIDSYSWIKEVDSDEISNKPFFTEHQIPYTEELTFQCMKDIKWDGIFICKSPLWSPPHLDEMFKDIFIFVENNPYGSYVWEDSSIENRFEEIELLLKR